MTSDTGQVAAHVLKGSRLLTNVNGICATLKIVRYSTLAWHAYSLAIVSPV